MDRVAIDVVYRDHGRAAGSRDRHGSNDLRIRPAHDGSCRLAIKSQ